MNIEALQRMVELTKQNREDIDEHLLTLFALTLSMKPHRVIELGVRSARSSYAFLAACYFLGAKLTSVDINDREPSLHFPSEWEANWNFIKKDAIQFLEEDAGALWDTSGNIIYVDDWHAGDHVEKEILLIEKFVTPKDLIILHDLMYGNSQPYYRSVTSPNDKQWDKGGPYAPISQLDLGIWEYVTIPRCHGLTLLRKKASTVLSD
jgi:hypothetical protein